MRDTRSTRHALAVFLTAGIVAIIGERILGPTIRKGLKAR